MLNNYYLLFNNYINAELNYLAYVSKEDLNYKINGWLNEGDRKYLNKFNLIISEDRKEIKIKAIKG